MNSHCAFIHLLNLLIPRNSPLVAYWKTAVTHNGIKLSMPSLHQGPNISFLWHQGNSPLNKGQFKVQSRYALPACHLSMLDTSTLHFYPKRERQLLQPGSGFAGQRSISALPKDTSSCCPCCSFPPTDNPIWWEKSCRLCEHVMTHTCTVSSQTFKFLRVDCRATMLKRRRSYEG